MVVFVQAWNPVAGLASYSPNKQSCQIPVFRFVNSPYLMQKVTAGAISTSPRLGEKLANASLFLRRRRRLHHLHILLLRRSRRRFIRLGVTFLVRITVATIARIASGRRFLLFHLLLHRIVRWRLRALLIPRIPCPR